MKPTIAILAALVASAALSYGQSGPVTIRVGAFPNITHAQAMAGKANGWFEKGLGPNVKIEWKTFNAGPSAMEAMFAGAIDMAYIGPNPTISGYVRSEGEALRVVAGAASGGASLVVQNDSGGDVQVLPMANADQLTLFVKGQLDAAWAPEPWATRLIREGNGRLFLDERQLWPHGQFVVTNLIVSTKFLHERPDLVKYWIRAQVDLTDWIRSHPPEAKKLVNDQIQRETGKSLPPAIINEAFTRFEITDDPIRMTEQVPTLATSSLLTSAQSAFRRGFSARQCPTFQASTI